MKSKRLKSERVSIRIDEDLLGQAIKGAERESISLSAFVRRALIWFLSRKLTH